MAAKAGESRRVFSSSMCDIWEDHPDIAGERRKLWALIRATPNLDWQLLTKRPERIAGNLPADWGRGWPNVWLGTSIENADYMHRAHALRQIPAAVRFISYEPALGPLGNADLRGIHWLIAGGESGPGYRPMPLEWVREVRANCRKYGTAFFFKQSAAPRTEMGTTLDGETVREFPMPRRVVTFKSKNKIMSNRLHIGPTEDGGYDCVIEASDGAREKLLDWMAYCGPWKIRIEDIRVYREIEPTLEDMFSKEIGEYPDDVSGFYHHTRSIEHPTREELDAWLKGCESCPT